VAETKEPPQAVHLLRKFAFAYTDRIAEIAAEAGLHPTDLRALVELLDAERAGRRLTAGGLADALGMTTPATTALLKRMERQQLLTRRRSEVDGRRIELFASPHAIELGWRHFGEVVDLLAEVINQLDARSRVLAEKILQQTLDALERRTSSTPRARPR